jgi:predicted outer membrane lipoprotein
MALCNRQKVHRRRRSESVIIVAAFGVLGAAAFWFALMDEHNRGRQDWFNKTPGPSCLIGKLKHPAG